MTSYKDRAGGNKGHGVKLVDSRDTFPLNPTEDLGESVRRTKSSNATDVETHPVLTFDIATGPGQGVDAKKRFHERERADLDAAKPANRGTEFPQPTVVASIAGLKSYALSEPVERQKQRKSATAIDDLFQGLH